MDNAILNQNIHFKCSFHFDLLQNIRYSSLIFSYSIAEYWKRFCGRSTWFIRLYSVLNDALRVVTDASIPLKRTT